MSDGVSVRHGWVLPVLLSVAVSVALGFGFLYLARPNAGELGAIRVVITDDDGKSGNSIRVIVAEAPFVQKETVSPGMNFSGIVHYPSPYRTRPNLKLTSGKRPYDVIAETERGFTWRARLLPEDLRENAAKEGNLLDKLLGDEAALAALKGNIKPGLTFEDFTWEAKGLRAPPSAFPKTYEQKGTFYSEQGREATEFFPVPYESPPNVQLSSDGFAHRSTTILECTAKSFKWRHAGVSSSYGTVTWTANGIRTGSDGK